MPTHEEKKKILGIKEKNALLNQLLAQHVQESLLQPQECGESHGRAT